MHSQGETLQVTLTLQEIVREVQKIQQPKQ